MSFEVRHEFPHDSQVKGFTPVCVILCTLRLLEFVNDFPHVSQVKDFTPVCVISCTLRWLVLANDFPHNYVTSERFHTCLGSFMPFEVT